MLALKILSSITYVGIMSVFWRLGGADHFSKNWRRLGAPITSLIYCLIMGLYWQAPLIAGLIWLVSTLPITLIGSEVLPKNIAWIICLGTFYGVAPAIASFPNLFWMIALGGLYTLVYSTLVIGSELYRKKTGKDIWWLQEYLSGGILGMVIVGGAYLS